MESYESHSLTSSKKVTVTPEVVNPIREKLASPNTPLPERFRCVFTLQNLGGPLAIEALSTGTCTTRFNLFFHWEINTFMLFGSHE